MDKIGFLVHRVTIRVKKDRLAICKNSLKYYNDYLDKSN